jgi:hypothetical protein
MIRGDAPGPYEPREVLWDLAITLRTNRIYYEGLLRRVERLDLWLRVGAAFCASTAVLTGLKQLEPYGIPVTLIAGLLAATINIATVALALPDRIKNAATIHPQYVDLMGKVDRLYGTGPALLTQEDIAPMLDAATAIERLEAEKIRYPDGKKLREAHEAAQRELGITPLQLASHGS